MKKIGENIIIEEKEFNLKNIFENGQAFNWEKMDDKYIVVADKYLVSIYLKDDKYIIENGKDIDFWFNYFDMSKDYKKIRQEFSDIDINLKKACDFGKGLRVLNQDLFEMIISFIISANNQIPRIKKSIKFISELCGNYLGEINGNKYYSFPDADKLSSCSIEDLKEKARVGYRASYIKETSSYIVKNPNFLSDLKEMDYELAHKKLCELKGIGPKVADCILLFALGKDEAFPVDTWVIKLMNEYYLKDEKNVKIIKEAGRKIFKNKAGLAQQYLFYYARENKIGGKK